jgi:Undecaprenyl-phosphate galactose phosphotransferase WbaP
MSATQTVRVYSDVADGHAAIFSGWETLASIVAGDVIALSIVYWLAVILRYVISPAYDLSFYLHLYPGIGLFLMSFVLQGLYPGILMHPAEELRRVSYGITTVFLLIGATTFVTRDAEAYSRSVFLVTWSAGVPAILLMRTGVRKVLSRLEWWGVPAVVLGSGVAAKRVVAALDRRWLGIRVLGVLESGELRHVGSDFPPALGPLEIAPQLAAQGRVAMAIVAMPDADSAQLRTIIQDYCRGFRHILLIPDLPHLCSLGVTGKDVGGELGIEVPQQLFHWGARLIKRSLDIAGGCLGLLIAAPAFGAIAVAIKLTSNGPIFYDHPRHGQDGGIFSALKFRTMVTNGDEVLERFFRNHPEELLQWRREHKLKDDPRITGVGRWLRRFSLDELPQLLNVLKGQMSLVGPRPIVPNEFEQYGQSFGFCTSVRPGITGLWQVSGRNNLTFADRIRFNEYYIRNWSLWLDLYILFKTVTVVVMADGAY